MVIRSQRPILYTQSTLGCTPSHDYYVVGLYLHDDHNNGPPGFLEKVSETPLLQDLDEPRLKQKERTERVRGK